MTQNQAKIKTTVVITPDDLPLSCPSSSSIVWNKHPRVYLPIEANSDYRCPYCSQLYHLDGEPKHHHF